MTDRWQDGWREDHEAACRDRYAAHCDSEAAYGKGPRVEGPDVVALRSPRFRVGERVVSAGRSGTVTSGPHPWPWRGSHTYVVLWDEWPGVQVQREGCALDDVLAYESRASAMEASAHNGERP